MEWLQHYFITEKLFEWGNEINIFHNIKALCYLFKFQTDFWLLKYSKEHYVGKWLKTGEERKQRRIRVLWGVDYTLWNSKQAQVHRDLVHKHKTPIDTNVHVYTVWE